MEDYQSDGVRLLRQSIPRAEEIFEQLKLLSWQKVIWGKTNRPLPRLCLGEIQFLPLGRQIVQWLTSFFFETMGVKCQVYGIFGNNYRTGSDWLPDHRDNYDVEGAKLHVVSLSFGATRQFHFVDSNSGKMENFDLNSGDIIMFSPEKNHRSKHGIKKQPKVEGQRINLTCFCLFPEGNPYTAEFIDALIPPI